MNSTGRSLLIIPAAGAGSRLSYDGPKCLFEVAGKAMLWYVIKCHRELVDEISVVVSPRFKAVVGEWLEAEAIPNVNLFVQPEPTGMLDAIMIPAPFYIDKGLSSVTISWCDQICISAATAQTLAEKLKPRLSAGLVFSTIEIADPYIHMQRDSNGVIHKVLHRREGDTMPAVGENDCGLFGLSASTYFHDLKTYSTQVELGVGTGERNFLPFITWFTKRGRVETFTAQSSMEAVGVNTRGDAIEIEQYWGNS
jgi:bifunctional N-acetylglucosamine-1-phosphate-uridyltransferase/glucosamine-1-phosphate-acetyltransferase GlmU-like protein